jgi:hypothetical protein
MAKVRFQAGAEMDYLSTEEHAKHLNKMAEAVLGNLRDRDGEYEQISPAQITLDGSGNGSGAVALIRPGFRAWLTRLVLDYPSSSFKTASVVAANVRVTADTTDTPAQLRIGIPQLPYVWEASKSHAPFWQAGQRISVFVYGGPTTTTLTVTGQIILIPVDRRVPRDILTGTGS